MNHSGRTQATGRPWAVKVDSTRDNYFPRIPMLQTTQDAHEVSAPGMMSRVPVRKVRKRGDVLPVDTYSMRQI